MKLMSMRISSKDAHWLRMEYVHADVRYAFPWLVHVFLIPRLYSYHL
jgi:hypothetical protein